MSAPQPLLAERYRLIRSLGQGGMGRVWLARDEVLHRDVAIKEVVPPQGLTPQERDDMRTRTLREARTAARLNHPSVVRVYDIVQTDVHPWIVMEYVPSRSLHQVINEDGALPPDRVAEIGLQVLGALRAAHRANVLHRDVKPSNVLLTDDGRVVLTDFGLATMPGEATVTRPGMVLGSPAYIAPERARQGHAGHESDLWSLGATLYAAVEGSPPYQRSSAIETLTALVTEEPPPPRHAGLLRPVLNGLLCKDPAERMGAEEAERLLRRAAGGRIGSRLRLVPRSRPRATWVLPVASPASKPAPAPTPGPSASNSSAPGPSAPAPASAADAVPGEAASVAGPAVDSGSAVDSAAAEPAQAAPASADPAPAAAESTSAAAESAEGTADSAPAAAESTPAATADATAVIRPSGGEPTTIIRPDAGAAERTRIVSPRTRPQPSPAAAPTPAGDVAMVDGVERIERPEDAAAASAAPTDAPGAPDRRVPRPWLIAVIVVAVIVALVVASVALARSGGRANRAHGPASTASSRPATAKAVPPPASASPQSSASSAPAAGTGDGSASPSAPPTPGGPAIPAGWRLYSDPTGFSVAVPEGWTITHDGTMIYFHDPSEGRLLGIDQTDTPNMDPVADWTNQRDRRVPAGDFPGYQEIGIRAVDYWKACADWEFTYDRGNGRVHAINRGFVTSDHQAYGIWWSTPDSIWQDSLSYFQTITSTFKPKP